MTIIGTLILLAFMAILAKIAWEAGKLQGPYPHRWAEAARGLRPITTAQHNRIAGELERAAEESERKRNAADNDRRMADYKRQCDAHLNSEMELLHQVLRGLMDIQLRDGGRWMDGRPGFYDRKYAVHVELSEHMMRYIDGDLYGPADGTRSRGKEMVAEGIGSMVKYEIMRSKFVQEPEAPARGSYRTYDRADPVSPLRGLLRIDPTDARTGFEKRRDNAEAEAGRAVGLCRSCGLEFVDCRCPKGGANGDKN